MISTLLSAASGFLGGALRSWLDPNAKLALGWRAAEFKGLAFNGIAGLVISVAVGFASGETPAALILFGLLAGYVGSDLADSLLFIIAGRK